MIKEKSLPLGDLINKTVEYPVVERLPKDHWWEIQKTKKAYRKASVLACFLESRKVDTVGTTGEFLKLLLSDKETGQLLAKDLLDCRLCVGGSGD